MNQTRFCRSSKILLSITTSLFLSAALRASDTPHWFTAFKNGKTAASSLEIEGVGYAKYKKKDIDSQKDARKAATSDAMAQIAMQLESTVQSSVSFQVEESVSTGTGKAFAQAAKAVSAVTADMVMGQQQLQEYADETSGVYYVRAVMQRSEAERKLQEVVVEKKKQSLSMFTAANTVIKTAEEALSRGEITTAATQYVYALKVLAAIQVPVRTDTDDSITATANAQARLSSMISGIRISAVAPKLYAGKQASIKTVAITVLGSKSIPVKNLPFSVDASTGAAPATVITGQDGTADLQYTPGKTDKTIISLAPDFSGTGVGIKPSSFTFTFDVADARTAVGTVLYLQAQDLASAYAPVLAEFLSANKYSVTVSSITDCKTLSSDTALQITGTVKATALDSKVNGIDFIPGCVIQAEIKAENCRTGALYYSFTDSATTRAVTTDSACQKAAKESADKFMTGFNAISDK